VVLSKLQVGWLDRDLVNVGDFNSVNLVCFIKMDRTEGRRPLSPVFR